MHDSERGSAIYDCLVVTVKMSQEIVKTHSVLIACVYSAFLCSEQNRLEDQKKWLDQEIEKILEQRRQVEDLEAVSGGHYLIKAVK